LLEEGTLQKRELLSGGFVRQFTLKDRVTTLEYALLLASSTLSLIEGKEGVLFFEQYGGRYWI
jgi:hypothetical protein